MTLLSTEKIRMGDVVELRNGETIVADGFSDWYEDREGRHEGPWITVRGKTFERYLRADVVRIVKRNPRLCRFCGEGVTATTAHTDFCRNCFYNGTFLEELNSEILDLFQDRLPMARSVGIEHTGGGCFWLAVYGPEGSPYYWAVTDGEAGIPDFEKGEGWGIAMRYSSHEDSPEYEGVPILESDHGDTGWYTPTLGHQAVIDAILADMVSVGAAPMRAYAAIVVAPAGVKLIDRVIEFEDEPLRMSDDVMVWHGDEEAVSCGVIAPTREAAYQAIERVWPKGVTDDLGEAAEEDAVLRLIRKRPGYGKRFKLKCPVDRYPHFIAPAGATGTIIDHDDPDLVALRLDEHLEGAEEWENEVIWYLPNGDDPWVDMEEAS